MNNSNVKQVATQSIQVGSKVRPVNDGEDSRGNRIAWTRLRGIVVDSWLEGSTQRVEVRWNGRAPYPTRLDASWLVTF